MNNCCLAFHLAKEISEKEGGKSISHRAIVVNNSTFREPIENQVWIFAGFNAAPAINEKKAGYLSIMTSDSNIYFYSVQTFRTIQNSHIFRGGKIEISSTFSDLNIELEFIIVQL